MSLYQQEYDKLAKKGFDYFKINRIMIKTAERNEIQGKSIPIKDKAGKIDDYVDLCSNCETILTKEHFYCEKTDYSCDLWFKCPNCGKYNRFVD